MQYFQLDKLKIKERNEQIAAVFYLTLSRNVGLCILQTHGLDLWTFGMSCKQLLNNIPGNINLFQTIDPYYEPTLMIIAEHQALKNSENIHPK